MYDILEVIRNIEGIYENNTNLSVLKDFERVLDVLDMYAYENWYDGELAYGPQVDRHWITAGFMWPRDKMPNPTAAKRLTDLGCRVIYEKSNLVEPRKIESASDYRPGTKKGKLDRHPIWIVEIQMPKKVAFDIFRGYMNKLKSEQREDLEDSAPATLPQAAMPQQAAPMAPGGMPSAAPGGMAPAGGGMAAPGGIAPSV
jgi:hypothetical protein